MMQLLALKILYKNYWQPLTCHNQTAQPIFVYFLFPKTRMVLKYKNGNLRNTYKEGGLSRKGGR